eukprot:1678272-Pyramimonas_sp.AAC.1
MCCNLCRAIYVLHSTWCNLCGAIFDASRIPASPSKGVWQLLAGFLETILSHARLESVGGYLELRSAILGLLEAVIRRLGDLSVAILSHAWLSWAMLKAILSYLGLSWSHIGPKRVGWRVCERRWEASWRNRALLNASWAI